MTKYIELRGIYAKGEFTSIDDEDYDLVKDYVCYGDKRGYVYIKIGRNKYLLHQFIMKHHGKHYPMIDHKNRNRKDNRKKNLRSCTNSQNQANTRSWMGRDSKGVHFSNKKWVARIMFQGTRKFLGGFENKDDAIRAYQSESVKLFGEFAYHE